MITKKKVLLATTAAMLILGGPMTASAQDKAPGSGPSPYVDCGIGAALFPNTNWAAVTSNIIWDAGTTAVTSATASPETCEGSSAEAAKFIHDTYDRVVENTARGEGKHLTALLQIYGCKFDSHAEIVSTIRGEIGETVSQDSYAEMSALEKSEAYFLVIDSRVKTDFSESCAA